MLKGRRTFFSHRGRDERGAEFAAALFVFPVLFILIIGCIEIGFYVQTRMRVENVLRDAARSVAAEGGDFNIRTRPLHVTTSISAEATSALVSGSTCKVSQCDSGLTPLVRCTPPIVLTSGTTVTCKLAAKYPYKSLSGTLMDGAFGLGIGGILQDFNASESARAETGTTG